MSKLLVGKIILGMYQTNCYFIHEEGSSDAVLIDPADSGEYIINKLSEEGLKVKAVLLTHGHFDHIYGVAGIKDCTGAPVYAGKDEEILLKDPSVNCSSSVGRSATVKPDVFLYDDDEISIAGINIKVIYTPGHTAGSVCYYIENEKVLFAGDTLFNESVGRTDLPTGSMSELVRSIEDKLMVLPGEVIVYPGHGPSTTIGHEKDYNPFL